MKKIGLLSIIGCSVSGVAVAAGVDCSVIPTCAEMGFTKSVTDKAANSSSKAVKPATPKQKKILAAPMNIIIWIPNLQTLPLNNVATNTT